MICLVPLMAVSWSANDNSGKKFDCLLSCKVDRGASAKLLKQFGHEGSDFIYIPGHAGHCILSAAVALNDHVWSYSIPLI